MAAWMTKRKNRRMQAREKRALAAGKRRERLVARVLSLPTLLCLLFVLAVCAIALIGEMTLGYSIGQRIDYPVYAKVEFRVRDQEQTTADREAARASTPSYYTPNATALTYDRIRADLMNLYQAANDSETFAGYEKILTELKWPADQRAYQRLRSLGDDAGRTQFQSAVNQLPLEQEYVVRDLLREPRDPKSATGNIKLEIANQEGEVTVLAVPHGELVPHGNERALRGSAAQVTRRFRIYEVSSSVEAIVLATFRDQPTIVYNRDRTDQEITLAQDATPIAMKTFENGKSFVNPGVVSSEDYSLLRAHHAAYSEFLEQEIPEARQERRARLLQRAGMVGLVILLSVGLLAYTRMNQRRVLEVTSRSIAFMTLMLGTTLAARLLHMKWPDLPELVFAPCLIASSVLAIAFPRRFSMGVMCIVAVLVSTMVDGSVTFLLALFTGVVVAVFLLDEIRSRTKIISSGVATALAVMIASAAGGLSVGNSLEFIVNHTLRAGACVLLASFVVSGVLPLVERLFGIATWLTLLEWRDPTRPLLQLLAREAPGTYNHSLMLGTLAEAACEQIGANGLLVQVGALYHDIGKIPKAEYFVENQEGLISRHDNLSPTMSLLIILGHVKDGIEMAKEYKLPRVLHQFIDEHHGNMVVRYFHYRASEKQPRIASGKHDREVPEAEFRYAGPKPRSRESAVLMLADGVEGAVRALHEPTASRIEGVVHQIVTERLNDGQFDNCEITLKEIRGVEDSLAKSLCSIYHGRVAYPKARKPALEESGEPQKVSV